MKIKKSNKYWKEAKKYIPGGNMILSKRPEIMIQIIGQHITKK